MSHATTRNSDVALKQAILKSCDDVSQLFRSPSHPTRLKVLCHLLEGERSVSELTDFCDIPQAGMSQFLARMKAEGLVTARREQQFIYYAIADKRLTHLLKSVKEIYC